VSLRARLVAGMAVVAIVLAVAAAFVTTTTRSHLIERVDAQLRAAEPRPEGGPRRGGPGGGPGGPPSGFDDAPRFEGRYSTLYAAYIATDGTVEVVSSPNLSGTELAAPAVSDAVLRSARGGHDAAPVTVDAESGSSLRYRMIARPADRHGDVLVLALPLEEVDAAVQRLTRVELGATAAILALLALVTSWVIRLGVQPIKRMTHTATEIAGGDLSARVEEGRSRTEAGELGVALNQMMGRIQEAFDERTRSEERLRQFVADASHELRTPVTTIRGYAELYRAGGLDDDAELGQAMRRTEQEAMRMGSLIEDLLLLARLDQGRPLLREPVDLGVLAVDAAGDARAVQPDRPVHVSVEEAVTVLGDDGRLRQIVSNLVTNALVHTPPDTPVHIGVQGNGGRAILEVRDEGPGMAPETAARAFERFYRADPARSRHKGGSGLGLAIVQATVAAHGGTVALTTAPGEGTTVRIELPTP
jgi:two-component system, OmpR family, sensor kinase